MLRSTGTALALAFGFLGTASAQAVIQTTAGNYGGSRYGAHVTIVGDLNQDGLDDYAVCASGSAPFLLTDPNAYVGIRSGLDGSLIRELHGPIPFQNFATSIAGPGDLNLDGTPDVVVGATPSPQWRRGNAFPFSGASGAILSFSPGMAPTNGFGIAVAAAGDINSDGRPDFAIGANSHSSGGLNAGAVFIMSVPPVGVVNLVLRSSIATNPGDLFGSVLASVGDLDGDGFSDLAVSAPTTLNGAATGYVEVLSGATGAVVHHLNALGAGDGYGLGLGAIGDIDGDTVGDIGVGAPLGTYAICYSGATGAQIRQHNDAQATQFGFAVEGVGDLNGDARSDYAIARPGPSFTPGTVDICSGADGSIFFTLVAQLSTIDQFGASLAGGSDLNGDGKLDIVVGEPKSFLSPSSVLGHAHVISLQ